MLTVAFLTVFSVAVFADWGIGGAAFYRSEAWLGQSTAAHDPNANQYSVGADLRFKQNWFLAEALLLYSTGVDNLDVYLDAGLVLDLAIFRLSLGAGQSFFSKFGENRLIQMGLNAKAGVEIMVGQVSVGISYIMALDYGKGIGTATPSGPLGVNVILWM